MTVKNHFNDNAAAANASVAATRQSFDKRIGEIITDIIGDDRLQNLFEAAGKHPDEYKDKPSGLIALDLGVVTPETKTALLIAQAAERTYNLAEKAVHVPAELVVQTVKSNPALFSAQANGSMDDDAMKSMGFVAADDPCFKFVGSERDPAALRKAQATWMASQAYLSNEIQACADAFHNPGAYANTQPLGKGHSFGLKAAAAKLYGQAGDMLEQQGHTEAAKKLKAVSASMNKYNAPAVTAAYNPAYLVSRLADGDYKTRLTGIGAFSPPQQQPQARKAPKPA